jgi:hypothetical protein
MLASTLGEPVAPADWARLPAAAWTVAGPASPPAGTLSADPVALFSAVSGLKQVGLAGDARRLAVEAALAAGL